MKHPKLYIPMFENCLVLIFMFVLSLKEIFVCKFLSNKVVCTDMLHLKYRLFFADTQNWFSKADADKSALP